MFALLVPSPTSPRASTMATSSWCAASSRAIAEPTMPAPITTTSWSVTGSLARYVVDARSRQAERNSAARAASQRGS